MYVCMYVWCVCRPTYVRMLVCMYVWTLISPIKAKDANKDHVLQKNDNMKS